MYLDKMKCDWLLSETHDTVHLDESVFEEVPSGR